MNNEQEKESNFFMSDLYATICDWQLPCFESQYAT